MTFTISKPDRILQGEITLAGSKSISNRVLMIRALSGADFNIKNLASSKDTELLQGLLTSDGGVLDAGAAGTTFRFMTALLAMQPGSRTLTGSPRMKQRPIGILVEALRQLGANIEYLEREGFPPLKINAPKKTGAVHRLSIPADTSSQYISALLMIAPDLPEGLTLELEGTVVSRPYIEMTLQLMARFGVRHEWQDNTIRIAHQAYQPRDFVVEADWPAASYYYAMAAFSEECGLTLNGLFKDSLQGDAVLPEMMESFGVKTVFGDNSIRLLKPGGELKPYFEWEFLPCPDLAQTLAVVCGGLGMYGLFTGLETLRIKETDRISALQHELAKVQVLLANLPGRFSKKPGKEFFVVEGKAVVEGCPVFETYEDHRMAMAFAPLAMFGEIRIENPQVVEKSYPAFWDDLRKLGFSVQEAQ